MASISYLTSQIFILEFLVEFLSRTCNTVRWREPEYSTGFVRLMRMRAFNCKKRRRRTFNVSRLERFTAASKE